jgi:Zn-dependent protease with chaperone function
MNVFEIRKSFGHKLIGSEFMKKVVCRALLLLPHEIAGFVAKHCWIVGSFEDGWAFTLKGSEIGGGEYLIFLSDELLNAGEAQMRYTLIHEIGHVVLGHRNSIGEVQTKVEIRLQEKEADEFAISFLRS